MAARSADAERTDVAKHVGMAGEAGGVIVLRDGGVGMLGDGRVGSPPEARAARHTMSTSFSTTALDSHE